MESCTSSRSSGSRSSSRWTAAPAAAGVAGPRSSSRLNAAPAAAAGVAGAAGRIIAAAGVGGAACGIAAAARSAAPAGVGGAAGGITAAAGVEGAAGRVLAAVCSECNVLQLKTATNPQATCIFAQQLSTVYHLQAAVFPGAGS